MRRFFRKFLCLLVGLPGWALATGTARGADEPYIGPYIQDLQHDAVAILWESEAKVAGEVELGESDAFTLAVKEPEPHTIHEVRVTGLRPDTRYTYRVKWDGKTSATFSFRTMPPMGSRRFRLAAYGDSRSNPVVHSEIVRRMLSTDPDVVIHTGDLVSDGSKKEYWKPQFFDPLRPLAARTPVIPCLGNHEKDSGLCYDYFPFPDKAAWFSYRWANVHFIVLDSQKPYEAGSDQYKWLEKELEGPDADWRVAFFHYPMFSCHPSRNVNGNRWAWQDLLDRHGVDLVLTGHDHYYHRTQRIGRAWDRMSEGVYHVTTAGGGASLYPVEEKVYTARAQSIHHFMVLDFDGKKVTGEVITVDGKTIDKFAIDRTRPEATPFVSYEMILWEKALSEAVDKLEPELVGGDAGRLEWRIKLPSFFSEVNSIAYRWAGGSSFWAADLCDGVVEAKDKAPFEVMLWGEGPLRAAYPLPRLELTPVKGPEGGRDFLNRTIALYPLRLARNGSITAPALPGKIQVDGKLDEPAWEKASEARGFTRDFGRILSERETLLIGHDEKGMVLGARVRSLVEKPLEKGAKDRDTRHMYRTDEAVTLVLMPPSILKGKLPITFLFSGNSRGTRFDSLGGVTQWNPEWEFATAEVPGGWTAEARIPWIVLGVKGRPSQAWKINLLRWDTTDKALSEWAPTFSLLGTERKHDGEVRFRE